MAGILKSGGAFLQSPAAGVAMGAVGAFGKTAKGNQAAKASQDPMALFKGSQGQVGYLSDPRHLQGASQAMTAHGQNQMGAEIIGNSMVNSGSTLTSQQGKALDPQARQKMQQQGAVAPSFMQNMMSPQMLTSLLQLFGQGQGGNEEEEQVPTAPTQGGY